MAAPGLTCDTWDLHSCLRHAGDFGHSMWTLDCSMQYLVPWPGIKPRPSAVAVWNLSHWTTREVPKEEILKGEKSHGKVKWPDQVSSAKLLVTLRLGRDTWVQQRWAPSKLVREKEVCTGKRKRGGHANMSYTQTGNWVPNHSLSVTFLYSCFYSYFRV